MSELEKQIQINNGSSYDARKIEAKIKMKTSGKPVTKRDFVKVHDGKFKAKKKPRLDEGPSDFVNLASIPRSNYLNKRMISILDKEEITDNLFSNADTNFLGYKSNFMVKFARLSEQFEKISGVFDKFSDERHKQIIEFYKKLTAANERKERVLFDNFASFSKAEMLNRFKECIGVFYDYENNWLKLADCFAREIREMSEKTNFIEKKLGDEEIILRNKESELDQLNNYIKENDINYKAFTRKKKMKEVSEVKAESLRREKELQIQIFKLEQENKDLYTLLESDKDHYEKNKRLEKKLQDKEHEIEDNRIKANIDIEEKVRKIDFLSNQKEDLQEQIQELDSKLEDFKNLVKSNERDHIEFIAKLNIMNKKLETKEEQTDMLINELEQMSDAYYKELEAHRSTQELVDMYEKRAN